MLNNIYTCQIPIPAHSTPVIFTAKCRNLQIPCHEGSFIFQYLQIQHPQPNQIKFGKTCGYNYRRSRSSNTGNMLIRFKTRATRRRLRTKIETKSRTFRLVYSIYWSFLNVFTSVAHRRFMKESVLLDFPSDVH